MKQREAVYNTTVEVLKENGINFDKGENVTPLITETIRESINAIICEGLINGDIDMKDTPSNQAKKADPKKMKEYVSGLISNWFRKDPDLNGSVKYQAKNPGSRSGQSDSKLKALRNLKKQFEAAGKETEEIDGYITARLTEINAEKAKKIEVDMNEIPAELKESLGIE